MTNNKKKYNSRKQYLKDYCKKYYLEHKKEYQERAKVYYQQNKSAYIDRAKEHYKNHTEEHKMTTVRNRLVKRLKERQKNLETKIETNNF